MYRLVVLAAAGLLLGGCTTTDESGERRPNRQATGAVIGAVTGAVIGKQVGNDRRSTAAGAVLGGVTGAVIGGYMDRQEAEFKEALEEEREANAIQVERVRDDLLKLTLDSEVSFDFDSAAIRPTFRPSLDKLTDVLRKYDRTDVTIVGHTDSVGSEAYNQRLSERRAVAVAGYLGDRGLDRFRLRTEGRGESQPRADNATAGGRQLNRRVEVFVRPDEAQFRDAAQTGGR